MVLIASRAAKIKFSIEKSSFFTTNIKVLGYSFDTIVSIKSNQSKSKTNPKTTIKDFSQNRVRTAETGTGICHKFSYVTVMILF